MAFSQSAPRQRTAIACRYCRRRKVSKAFLLQLFRKNVVLLFSTHKKSHNGSK
jgi:hypothetical protein